MTMTPSSLMQQLQQHRQFLVAFSGGLDSTVLLHQLVCWWRQEPGISLRAIHIHHGISQNADRWVEHCQQLCAEWQVPLVVERVTLMPGGAGLEAEARAARYQAFREALLPGEVLLTAQHLDDQSETLLLALKRGSGPAGLSAMPVSATFADTQLIRPLLHETRATLLLWAQRYGLRWIEDESNQDDAYDRNFLRLRVLPLLNARWPHFAEAAARSAALCGEQEQLLDELLADELSRLLDVNGSLAIDPLVSMSGPKRAALLRRWLAAMGATMPSREMLTRLWQEVALAREDASPCLRLGDFDVRRFQQRLWRVKALPGQTDRQIEWQNLHAPLVLPDGLGQVSLLPGGNIHLPRADEPVTIRFKAPGMLHIVGRHGGRKLKKIWQELGVPPWLRDTTPLLFYGDTLIAAAGRFVTQEGGCEAGAGVQLSWQKTGS
ncbi:TPA: tRNA lysidine(34) synthetase TilS [Kluyvera georgiana]|uniref:tRNA lysidine(34) synthetase TilS n=1 Tax=Kluyvera georgiana TaxID=73098 RepID=UPI0008070F12|nr:tRNA lysidine(34) synthetase TilS [Kluyvera georgiana]MDA8492358.1 tRNA lysidine(34) synthetase TilS [Kluyvera georgiana]HDG1688873.1 tRNA lysidine(34) synthetase TilS [Kluyvera georgiana]HED1422064.1 tRNA lysidine(34) synthetase TilS [Kluyvera georgiana]